MTATYWEVGRRIVEFEQGGQERAAYGEALIERLSADLSARFGRGFSRQNLWQMRLFYTAWSADQIPQTLSGESVGRATLPTVSGTSPDLPALARNFPLPWSAYVRLLSVKSPQARAFYETETLRGGWSVRQLDRQINSQFYERTALSNNKSAMLVKGEAPQPGDAITPEQAIKDPFVLEFLNLKDEYSESELEEGLIQHLADFLLELGDDFAFVGRQRRLRIDDSWFRVDLLFFHRRLRCLLIIDLKVGKFSYTDAGQMHLYLNYAREHWTRPGENPPVGLILFARRRALLKRTMRLRVCPTRFWQPSTRPYCQMKSYWLRNWIRRGVSCRLDGSERGQGEKAVNESLLRRLLENVPLCLKAPTGSTSAVGLMPVCQRCFQMSQCQRS